ncbi:GYD family protein [Pseudomonas protegens]|uniref:GYD domain-containing protein n=1 Tax=Pseudomonas protegens TaxID=380021 RepID=UPI000F4C6F91|nr:GYD domain-containing protein [Pseudomonas protegens]ROL65696.1 GYD family protein [Pseudomonas protegens]
MPLFISLMRMTDKGLAELKSSPERGKISRERVERLGGTSHALFATMGLYDFIQVFEMPSETLMMEYLLTARQDGHVEPLVLRAFDSAEWNAIVHNATNI